VGWIIRIQFLAGAGIIFLLNTSFRPALRPTQPPIQQVQGVLCPGIKQLGHEADHSPPSCAKVKNM